ncbi:hypothetical protein JDV02_006363 [Purpureocillium takamizusanense]|uniref:Uncharacterized protein n=1 Tax=Purpureocillium takamizusanense TaxID=2060973 RepID=A0A9Q8QIE5_9HYPO|nr:uncharacterized protein JDV02_006363 [Purpureocillium takamizusanense]UNI20260.1 hypothetical protein JDV02_006363 [Purpureocillium takamizusanense]
MSTVELRAFAQKLLHERDSRPLKREVDIEDVVECEGRKYKLLKQENGEEAVDLTED